MLWRAVWALAGGAAVMLSSVVAHAQCTKDTDCKGERVCEGGKCTFPVPPAPPPAAAPPEGAPPDGASPPPVEGQPAAEPVAPPPAELAPVTPEKPLDAGPDPSTAAPAAATKPLGSDEPEVRRRNRNMMVGGIVMVAIGPVALLGALSARSSQEDCDQALEARYPEHQVPSYDQDSLERCDNYTVPIYLFGIGGAVLIAGGIPMIIYGGKNVAAPAKKAELVPWATPTSGGLKLRLDL